MNPHHWRQQLCHPIEDRNISGEQSKEIQRPGRIGRWAGNRPYHWRRKHDIQWNDKTRMEGLSHHLPCTLSTNGVTCTHVAGYQTNKQHQLSNWPLVFSLRVRSCILKWSQQRSRASTELNYKDAKLTVLSRLIWTCNAQYALHFTGLPL